MKNDIQTVHDIETLVNHFYSKIKQDPIISDFFGKVVPIDWDHHLPIMVGFWNFILFSVPNSYVGNVMNPHFTINEYKMIENIHFETWLKLFNESVDDLFEGIKADEAKNSAFSIGATMKYKMNKINELR